MSVHEIADIYWDPYDPAINTDPYPLYRRMRDEAPVYYNDRYDFYALSRADDLERAFADHKRLISGRSDILDYIKLNLEFPPGIFIFEDPPRHTRHRGVLSRVFTPRRMAALEPRIRALCCGILDPLVGRAQFDFVTDFGALVASQVIGMLLGIPESDQAMVHSQVDQTLHHVPGQPMEFKRTNFEGDLYAEYVDWRADHPSDDLMTDLLNVEFEDEEGTTRRLTRGEVLAFVTLLSGAGNDTTSKLIGWTGKLLSDHPDQRRMLTEDPTLIPDAIEEILRYEPPGAQNARYAVEDVEFSGQTVPADSIVVCLMGAANHDDRRFPDGDRFDILRRPSGIMTFSFGVHFCLGAALARAQGRVALDEVLTRFPSWTVDGDGAVLNPSPTTRGYDALPVLVG